MVFGGHQEAATMVYMANMMRRGSREAEAGRRTLRPEGGPVSFCDAGASNGTKRRYSCGCGWQNGFWLQRRRGGPTIPALSPPIMEEWPLRADPQLR